MITKWFSNLPSDQQESFKRSVKGANPVLERLIEICQERFTTIESDALNFDSPSWPYLQASLVGRKDELRMMINLLTLDQEDKNIGLTN